MKRQADSELWRWQLEAETGLECRGVKVIPGSPRGTTFPHRLQAAASAIYPPPPPLLHPTLCSFLTAKHSTCSTCWLSSLVKTAEDIKILLSQCFFLDFCIATCIPQPDRVLHFPIRWRRFWGLSLDADFCCVLLLSRVASKPILTRVAGRTNAVRSWLWCCNPLQHCSLITQHWVKRTTIGTTWGFFGILLQFPSLQLQHCLVRGELKRMLLMCCYKTKQSGHYWDRMFVRHCSNWQYCILFTDW